MLRGLWRLTWIEIKVFLREPLGAIGTVVPVLLFVLLGRLMDGLPARGDVAAGSRAGIVRLDVPVLVAILIALNAVLSLVSIISIYREGGILKRLRATPLRSHTILTAHVLVKLLLTAATLMLMLLAGKQYFPPGAHVVSSPFGFAAALVISTLSILSIGFLIASVVPTARFAQPIGAIILYPMFGLSGLFVPLTSLPPILRHLPLAYAVSLLHGISRGDAWSTHLVDVAALAGFFVVFTALAARVFRWE